jgi:hypothetical protein
MAAFPRRLLLIIRFSRFFPDQNVSKEFDLLLLKGLNGQIHDEVRYQPSRSKRSANAQFFAFFPLFGLVPDKKP